MQRWTIHLEGGPRRVNHAAVAIGYQIFSFGGYCTGDDYETTRPMDVHILNTMSLRWARLPVPTCMSPDLSDVPYQRYGHTAVAVKDVAYIWGGRNDKDGACNVLFCFDTVTCLWNVQHIRSPKPGARDGHSACVINNKMYIFGGYEEAAEKFSNDIHVFDFDTMMWAEVKTKGTPACWRDFHTATPIGNIIYVFGGRSDEGEDIFTSAEIYCNKLHAFDTANSEWLEIASSNEPPIGRRSHSAFVYKGQLYIFGGYNGIRDKHYRDVHKFDPARGIWTFVKIKGQGPCARRRQCCSLIGDRAFLFGGTSPVEDAVDQSSYHTTVTADQDLMDHSDIYVLEFDPSLKTLCMLEVLRYKLDTSYLPRTIRSELSAMTTNNTISRPGNSNG